MTQTTSCRNTRRQTTIRQKTRKRLCKIPNDIDVGTSVVLVIDVQPEWWTPKAAQLFPKFPEHIQSLCHTCRSRGLRLIHIRAKYDHSENGYPYNQWLNQFVELNPEKPTCVKGQATSFARARRDEIVIYKPSFDSFIGTSLETTLKKLHVRTIYIAGMLTSVCVHHTAHGAFSRGYKVHVLRHCCADRTRERHNASLRLYGNYMYRVL